MTNPDCVFCKIVRKEIPAHIVYEDAFAIALLEIKPSAPGHTMVIPRRHGRTIIDFNNMELGQIMGAVRNTSEAIERAFLTNSLSIGINHKEEAGLPHLHIHIIPRWKNDSGGIMQTIVNNPPKETLKEVAEKIRKAVG
jgi:histidine triad (HIT) family protein